MPWPENPEHCHRGEPRYPDMGAITWRAAETEPKEGDSSFRPFRTCSYCGSIHPVDLVELLKLETFALNSVPEAERVAMPHMDVADMKYGFPHKIYVHSKRILFPEHDFVVSTNGKGEVLSRRKGCIPFIKFYTKHLDEPEASEADFLAIQALIEDHAGIDFSRDSRGLMWRRAQPKPVPNN